MPNRIMLLLLNPLPLQSESIELNLIEILIETNLIEMPFLQMIQDPGSMDQHSHMNGVEASESHDPH